MCVGSSLIFSIKGPSYRSLFPEKLFALRSEFIISFFLS